VDGAPQRPGHQSVNSYASCSNPQVVQ
jgi:hypothetical protein